MKLSICPSTPSRASFLAACLLVPQAVQSEKISFNDLAALPPGIDRLLDASKVQSQMHFGRSLEEVLDSFFADFIDDDITLNYLSGIDLDETFVQCLKETEALYEQLPDMEDEVVNFTNEVSMTTTMTSESLVIGIEYSEESRQLLRQFCVDAGGYFEGMSGTIECSAIDPETGMSIETIISGYGNCVANTMSCKSSERLISADFMALMFEAGGADCEITGGASTQEPPLPPATPVVEEEPEKPEAPPATPIVEEEPEEPEAPPATPIVEEEPEPEEPVEADQGRSLHVCTATASFGLISACQHIA